MRILDDISPDDVCRNPFPHVIAHDVLSPDLCAQLIAEFSDRAVTRGRNPASIVADELHSGGTRKFYMRAEQAKWKRGISPLWRQTLLDCVRPDIWRHFIRIFGDCLRHEYPDFSARYGDPGTMRTGVRLRDDFTDVDVLLDSKMLLHTSATERSEIERLPHLKLFSTIFLAYLFLRPDGDRSDGADFEFYSAKPGERILLGDRQGVRPEQLKLEAMAPYRKNTLVLFMNTARSYQGVTARSPSAYPYMALHFTAHLRSPLYDHEFRPGAVPDATPVELMYPPHRRTLRERVSYGVRRVTGRL